MGAENINTQPEINEKSNETKDLLVSALSDIEKQQKDNDEVYKKWDEISSKEKLDFLVSKHNLKLPEEFNVVFPEKVRSWVWAYVSNIPFMDLEMNIPKKAFLSLNILVEEYSNILSAYEKSLKWENPYPMNPRYSSIDITLVQKEINKSRLEALWRLKSAEISFMALFTHELRHYIDNQEWNCSMMDTTCFEQWWYTSWDKFLKENNKSLNERRNMFKWYFMDVLWVSEFDIRNELQDLVNVAYYSSEEKPEFRQTLKELYPEEYKNALEANISQLDYIKYSIKAEINRIINFYSN